MNAEDFCTYEQALTLKELGFKEECFDYYNKDKEFVPEFIPNDENELYECCDLYYSSNIDNDYVCGAPTLAQAQKWLRNAKKYSVEAFFERVKDGKEQWSYFISNILKNSQIDQSIGYFDSYEEALSTGITETIKLLENK